MYADYSQVQVILTFLIEVITLVGFGGCIAHSVLKHHVKLSKIYQEVPTASQQEVPSPISTHNELVEPITEKVPTPAVAAPIKADTPVITEVPKPEIPVVEVSVPAHELDIENMPIRVARKVASSLKIKQKVNGKDQPITWLRAQIKKLVQDNPHLAEKAIQVIQKTAA